jgi:hypothetical protein
MDLEESKISRLRSWIKNELESIYDCTKSRRSSKNGPPEEKIQESVDSDRESVRNGGKIGIENLWNFVVSGSTEAKDADGFKDQYRYFQA